MKGRTNSIIQSEYDLIMGLPNIYQSIEYLESDGKSYIDTLVRSHSNMSCELQFMFNVVPEDGCIIGARHTDQMQGDGKSRLYFYHYYRGHKLGYGTYLGKGTAEPDKIYNIKTRLDVGHQYMHINGTLAFEGFDDYYIDNEETYYIFALNDGNSAAPTDEQPLARATAYYTKAKLYYCKIWDDANLIRYFVPVYRIEDNVIGLYDLIGRQFYTNKGAGNFISGPEKDLIFSENNIV